MLLPLGLDWLEGIEPNLLSQIFRVKFHRTLVKFHRKLVKFHRKQVKFHAEWTKRGKTLPTFF